MTYAEAQEYAWQAEEAEGEQFAEWGSGAVSLGYNAAEWAPDYDGYRTSTDPTYAQAKAIIAKRQQALALAGFSVTYRFPDLSPLTTTTEEIPF